MNDAERFQKYGCVMVNNFIDQNMIGIISKYLENKIRRGEWKQLEDKEYVISKYSYYADPLIEVLLENSQENIENVTGKKLIPTYSYTRVYQPGEVLRPHTDRPSCEISVTVNVATKGEVSPIYTQYGKNDPEKHLLNPGDAVVYMGCEVMHWRQPLEDGQLNVQFMMHYVEKDGPKAAYAKDKRQGYGFDRST
jgi:hypothetical protein